MQPAFLQAFDQSTAPADPKPDPKQTKAVPKKASTAPQTESLFLPEVKLIEQSESASDRSVTHWGQCRIYWDSIAIPGLDASLCSNLARSSESSGWIADPQWLATRANGRAA